MVKWGTASVNINILGISELKWMEVGELVSFIKMIILSITLGKNSLEGME